LRFANFVPAVVLVVSATSLAEFAAAPADGPLTADQARQSFRLEPGLAVELVAAEPLVASPVAIAFDERGRLFVAENRGYPTGPSEGQPPAGRIAMLEDTDGDGRMDRRTEFADDLTYPNGVMPWNGGLIVTCAPDVLFLRDSDGDGKADQRTVLFTGFATTGSTQLRVSHPTLSIDNWIYLTSGLSGGKVTAPDQGDREPVELKRTDFRFRPDRSAWEAADGGAQFGMSFDDFGRRFICYNRVQVQHVVIDSKTLRRNPHLAFSETVQNCPAEMAAEPLKGHGAAARLFPLSQNVTTADSHAGTFTAACAVTVFRGTGLPAGYLGGAFSCDPTGNLIHFDRLEPAGATFAARRVRDSIEFLASTDNWFRPVFLANGPDGALYVCDMYRKTIEHPDYLPVEIRKHTDFESGKEMGRIWRVVRSDLKPADWRDRRRVAIADASTPQLCATLGHADGWHRDTARRLLLERRDKTAIEPLTKLAAGDAPQAAVLALRLLEAFDATPDTLLDDAMNHPAAGVRENVIAIAANRLPTNPRLMDRVLALADDADTRVRFHTAIALGLPASDREPVDPARVTALARIAARDGSDRWLRAAVFSSIAGSEVPFLTTLRSQSRGQRLPLDLVSELGRLIGASQAPESWPDLISRIVAVDPTPVFEEQAVLLRGLADAMRSRGVAVESGNVFVTVLGKADQRADARRLVASLFGDAARIARDGSQPLDRRGAAVGLLACADFASAGERLLKLIAPGEPNVLQSAAVRGLGMMRDDRVAEALLDAERFAAYTPALREEVVAAMISQVYHAPGLLSAIENGAVPVGAVDSVRRRQLTQHRDAAVRTRAEKLFGAVAGDRAKVYDAHKEVAGWKADAANGRVVFRRECASCHRLDREGFPVGPDLFGIRNQPKESILMHILLPDHEITQGFAAYTLATKDGRVLTGLIASETPTSVTLKQALGKEETVLRSDIEELLASKNSLMPQGVEAKITKQEFADLLAYLKGEGVDQNARPPAQ
jgi:putative membrane-bound dehydrogenase-like protein